MRCPFCASCDTIVKDSRTISDNTAIRRRRCCVECKNKFTTFEKIELRKLMVIKKSGGKKVFDREKVHKSIATALRKRNMSEEKINGITDDIVMQLKSSTAVAIPTGKIGELIMQKLAEVDQVAYIRFASVYQDFNDVKDFADFISQIKCNKK